MPSSTQPLLEEDGLEMGGQASRGVLVKKAAKSLQVVRGVLAALAVLDVLLVVAAFTTTKLTDKDSDGYSFVRTTEDCVVFSAIRVCAALLLFVSSFFRTNNSRSEDDDVLGDSCDGGWPMWVVFYVVFTVLTVAAGKGISFEWKDAGPAHCALLGASLALSVLHLIVIDRYMRASDNVRTARCVSQSPEVDDNKKKIKLPTRSLFRVLKPYFWPRGTLNKLRCISTWIVLGLSKGANLMSPIFIGRAVQQLRNGEPLGGVYWALVLFAGFTFASKALKELQNVIYLRVKQTAYTEIAEQTFMHLHSLSLEWHLKKKMGNVLRSMDRGVNASNTVVTYLFLYLGPTVVECCVVFVIFYTHFGVPLLSTVAFISFCLYSLCTVRITLWRKKFREQTNKHDNAYHDKSTDSLINYETVKYFTAEPFEVGRYVYSIEQFQKYMINTQLSLSFLNVLQQGIIQTCSAVSLCIAAHEVMSPGGKLEIGDFVSVNIYIIQLFAPLTFLGSVYNAVIQAFVDMANLSELLAEEPDVVDGPHSRDLVADPEGKGPSVEFRDISFHYPTQDPTSGLQGVNLMMQPGTVTAIVGKTGAGKTSISRLLFRFYDPIRGQVLISGQDIASVTQRSLRQAIGVVPQDTVMFNDTIRYNILYGKLHLLERDQRRIQAAAVKAKGSVRPSGSVVVDADIEKELHAACRQAQILDFILNLPEGFETKVGERGLKLSGGEKQRVSIARALLKDAPLAVLDEATSALDSRTERSVQDALNSLTKSRTTLVIAHRLSTIRKADQIVVLDKGKVVETGKFDDLVAKGSDQGQFAAMWAAQLDQGQ